MSGFTKIVLAVIGAIVVITGIVVGLVIFLSQPTLPDAQTPTPTTTPATGATGGGTTTGSGTTTGGTGTSTDTPGGISEDDASDDVTGSDSSTDEDEDDTDPIANTQGGVLDGLITAVCDVDGDPDGIGDEQGCLSACENLNGTDGFCNPFSGEIVQVVGCEDQTGISCGEEDDGMILDVSTAEVEFADYIDLACTIQMNLVEDPEESSNSSGDAIDLEKEFVSQDDALEYIVFQLDDCSDVEFPDEPPFGEPIASGGSSSGGGTTGMDVITGDEFCGEVCILDSDCGSNPDQICGNNGLCILEVCLDSDTAGCSADSCTFEPSDPTGGELPTTTDLTASSQTCGLQCIGDNDCEGANEVCSGEGVCIDTRCADNPAACVEGCVPLNTSDGSDEPAGAACNEACSDSTPCQAGNSCVNGTCISDFCAANPEKCDGNCLLPNTALISDELDPILYGALALVIGLIALATGAHVGLFYKLGGRNITAQFSEEEKQKLEQYRSQRAEESRRSQIKRDKGAVNLKRFEEEVLGD